jgi:hypothetical protein
LPLPTILSSLYSALTHAKHPHPPRAVLPQSPQSATAATRSPPRPRSSPLAKTPNGALAACAPRLDGSRGGPARAAAGRVAAVAGGGPRGPACGARPLRSRPRRRARAKARRRRAQRRRRGGGVPVLACHVRPRGRRRGRARRLAMGRPRDRRRRARRGRRAHPQVLLATPAFAPPRPPILVGAVVAAVAPNHCVTMEYLLTFVFHSEGSLRRGSSGQTIRSGYLRRRSECLHHWTLRYLTCIS